MAADIKLDDTIFAKDSAKEMLAKFVAGLLELLRALAPVILAGSVVANVLFVSWAVSHGVKTTYDLGWFILTPERTGYLAAIVAGCFQTVMYEGAYHGKIGSWGYIVAGIVSIADGLLAMAGVGTVNGHYPPEQIFPHGQNIVVGGIAYIIGFVSMINDPFVHIGLRVLGKPDQKSEFATIEQIREAAYTATRFLIGAIKVAQVFVGCMAIFLLDVLLSAVTVGVEFGNAWGQAFSLFLWFFMLGFWYVVKGRSKISLKEFHPVMAVLAAVAVAGMMVIGFYDGGILDTRAITGLLYVDNVGKSATVLPPDWSSNLYFWCVWAVIGLPAMLAEAFADIVAVAFAGDAAEGKDAKAGSKTSAKPLPQDQKPNSFTREMEVQTVKVGATIFQAAEGATYFKVIRRLSSVRLDGKVVDKGGNLLQDNVVLTWEHPEDIVEVVIVPREH